MLCRSIRVIGLVAIALTIASSTFAQTVAVAQLSGTVNDESNAALPGVDVTVTQTSTGMTRSVVTGSRGEYVFTNLPVGPYKVGAKLSGFSSFEQTGIVQIRILVILRVDLAIHQHDARSIRDAVVGGFVRWRPPFVRTIRHDLDRGARDVDVDLRNIV